KSSLQSIEPSSCTRHGWFRVASIDQYSSLLPPVGVWSVSQFQCWGSPSQDPYPSSSWCAVTTPTNQWDACLSYTNKYFYYKGCLVYNQHVIYSYFAGLTLSNSQLS